MGIDFFLLDGMTRNRDLFEYTDELGFTDHSIKSIDIRNASARVNFINWILGCPLKYEDYLYQDGYLQWLKDFDLWLSNNTEKLSQIILVDLGCGEAKALSQIVKEIFNLTWGMSIGKVIGIDRSLKTIINGIELLDDNFTQLSFNGANTFISVHGFLVYGNESDGEDFGINKQITELNKVSTDNMRARLTIRPQQIVADGSYSDSHGFVVRDITNSKTILVPIIKFLKDSGFNTSVYQPPFNTYRNYWPLPILSLTKSLES